MARSPNPRQLQVEVGDTHQAADHLALNALTDGARQVIETYDLKTANPDILISEIKGWQQSAVDALFQIGARLQLLHAVVPHGEWTARLADLGMNQSTARRIVLATVKYVGDGKARSDKLLGLGKSKLLELMVLDDDDIDILEAGGQVAELDLDEVARMSVSELRRSLREARQANEAKDALVQKKDQKINDLDTKLTAAKKFKPSKDSEARSVQEQAWLDEAADAVRAVEVHFARLSVVTADILAQCANEAINKRVAEGLRYVLARVTEIAKDNGFEQLDGDFTPEWMRGTPGKSGK